MPTTRSGGKPRASWASVVISSSGFVTTMTTASGAAERTCAADLGDDAAVALEQVGAALPGLARAARGDHDDVGAARAVVATRRP